MTEVWLRAALWLGLALAATLLSIRLRVATALSRLAITRFFRYPSTEATYATLLMSTRHYEELFISLRRQAQERNVTLETFVLVGPVLVVRAR